MLASSEICVKHLAARLVFSITSHIFKLAFCPLQHWLCAAGRHGTHN